MSIFTSTGKAPEGPTPLESHDGGAPSLDGARGPDRAEIRREAEENAGLQDSKGLLQKLTTKTTGTNSQQTGAQSEQEQAAARAGQGMLDEKRKRDRELKLRFILSQLSPRVLKQFEQNLDALVKRSSDSSQWSPEALKNACEELIKEVRGVSHQHVISNKDTSPEELVADCYEEQLKAAAAKEFGEGDPRVEETISIFRRILTDAQDSATKSSDPKLSASTEILDGSQTIERALREESKDLVGALAHIKEKLGPDRFRDAADSYEGRYGRPLLAAVTSTLARDANLRASAIEATLALGLDRKHVAHLITFEMRGVERATAQDVEEVNRRTLSVRALQEGLLEKRQECLHRAKELVRSAHVLGLVDGTAPQLALDVRAPDFDKRLNALLERYDNLAEALSAEQVLGQAFEATDVDSGALAFLDEWQKSVELRRAVETTATQLGVEVSAIEAAQRRIRKAWEELSRLYERYLRELGYVRDKLFFVPSSESADRKQSTAAASGGGAKPLLVIDTTTLVKDEVREAVRSAASEAQQAEEAKRVEAEAKWHAVEGEALALEASGDFDTALARLAAYRSQYPHSPALSEVDRLTFALESKRSERWAKKVRAVLDESPEAPVAALSRLKEEIGTKDFKLAVDCYERTYQRPLISDVVNRLPERPEKRHTAIEAVTELLGTRDPVSQFVAFEVRSHALITGELDYRISQTKLAVEQRTVEAADARRNTIEAAKKFSSLYSASTHTVLQPPDFNAEDPQFDAKLDGYLKQFETFTNRYKDLQPDKSNVDFEPFRALTELKGSITRQEAAAQSLEGATVSLKALEDHHRRSDGSFYRLYGKYLQEYGYSESRPPLVPAGTSTSAYMARLPTQGPSFTSAYKAVADSAINEIKTLHSLASTSTEAGKRAHAQLEIISWNATLSYTREQLMRGDYKNATVALIEHRQRFAGSPTSQATVQLLDVIHRFENYEEAGRTVFDRANATKENIRRQAESAEHGLRDARDRSKERAAEIEPGIFARALPGYEEAKRSHENAVASVKALEEARKTQDEIAGRCKPTGRELEAFTLASRRALTLFLDGDQKRSESALKLSESYLQGERDTLSSIKKLAEAKRSDPIIGAALRGYTVQVDRVDLSAPLPTSAVEPAAGLTPSLPKWTASTLFHALTDAQRSLTQASGDLRTLGDPKGVPSLPAATLSKAPGAIKDTKALLHELERRISSADSTKIDGAIEDYFAKHHSTARSHLSELQRRGLTGDDLLIASLKVIPDEERTSFRLAILTALAPRTLDLWIENGPGDREQRESIRRALLSGDYVAVNKEDRTLVSSLGDVLNSTAPIHEVNAFLAPFSKEERNQILQAYELQFGSSLGERLCALSPALNIGPSSQLDSRGALDRSAFFTILAQSNALSQKDRDTLLRGLTAPSFEAIKELVNRDLEELSSLMADREFCSKIADGAHDRAVLKATEIRQGGLGDTQVALGKLLATQRAEAETVLRSLDTSSPGFSARVQLARFVEDQTEIGSREIYVDLERKGSEYESASKRVAALLVDARKAQDKGGTSAEDKVLDATDTLRALNLSAADRKLVGLMVHEQIVALEKVPEARPKGYESADLATLISHATQASSGRNAQAASFALEVFSNPARYDERRIATLLKRGDEQRMLDFLVRLDPNKPETKEMLYRAGALRSGQSVDAILEKHPNWTLARQYLRALDVNWTALAKGDRAAEQSASITIEAFRLNRALTREGNQSPESITRWIMRIDREHSDRGIALIQARYNEIFANNAARDSLTADLVHRFNGQNAALWKHLESGHIRAFATEAAVLAIGPKDFSKDRQIDFHLLNDAIRYLDTNARAALSVRLNLEISERAPHSGLTSPPQDVMALLEHRLARAGEQDREFVKVLFERGSIKSSVVDLFLEHRDEVISTRQALDRMSDSAYKSYADAKDAKKKPLEEFETAKKEYESWSFNPLYIYGGGRDAAQQKVFAFKAFSELQQNHIDTMRKTGIDRLTTDRALLDTMARFATYEILRGDPEHSTIYRVAAMQTLQQLERDLSKVDWRPIGSKAREYFDREIGEFSIMQADYQRFVAKVEFGAEVLILTAGFFTGPVGLGVTAGLLTSYHIGKDIYNGSTLYDALWDHKFEILLSALPLINQLSRFKVISEIVGRTNSGKNFVKVLGTRKVWGFGSKLSDPRVAKIEKQIRSNPSRFFTLREKTIERVKAAIDRWRGSPNAIQDAVIRTRVVRINGLLEDLDLLLLSFARGKAVFRNGGSDPLTSKPSERESWTDRWGAHKKPPKEVPIDTGKARVGRKDAPPVGAAGKSNSGKDPNVYFLVALAHLLGATTEERSQAIQSLLEAQDPNQKGRSLEHLKRLANDAELRSKYPELPLTVEYYFPPPAVQPPEAPASDSNGQEGRPPTDPAPSSPTPQPTPPVDATPSPAEVGSEWFPTWHWSTDALSGKPFWSLYESRGKRDAPPPPPFQPPGPSTPPPPEYRPPRDPTYGSGRGFGLRIAEDPINVRAKRTWDSSDDTTFATFALNAGPRTAESRPRDSAGSNAVDVVGSHVDTTRTVIEPHVVLSERLVDLRQAQHNTIVQEPPTSYLVIPTSNALESGISERASFQSSQLMATQRVDASDLHFLTASSAATWEPIRMATNQTERAAWALFTGKPEPEIVIEKRVDLVDRERTAPAEQLNERSSDAVDESDRSSDSSDAVRLRVVESTPDQTTETSLDLKEQPSLERDHTEQMSEPVLNPYLEATPKMRVLTETHEPLETSVSHSDSESQIPHIGDKTSFSFTGEALATKATENQENDSIDLGEIVAARNSDSLRRAADARERQETAALREATIITQQLARSFGGENVPPEVQAALEGEALVQSRRVFPSTKGKRSNNATQQKRLRDVLVWQLLNRDFDKATRDRMLELLGRLGISQVEYRDLVAKIGATEATKIAEAAAAGDRVALTVEGTAVPEGEMGEISAGKTAVTPTTTLKTDPSATSKHKTSRADLYRKLVKNRLGA